VQKVNIEGNNQVPEEQLKEIIGLKAQEPLRLNELEESIQRIKQFYKDSGYLEMSLLNEKEDLVNYNEDNTLAQLKFKIYEGPKVIVGSILIEGNTLTKDGIILKELEFKVGDTLTPQKIEESISRLQRLGHFNIVDIRALEEKTQISLRTIVIRVIDRDPGLWNTGVGVTNERNLTLRGFAGLAYRNMFGTGRGISLRGDANYNVDSTRYLEGKFTAGYLEPYLFNTRMRGRVSYIQSVYITDYSNLVATETKQNSWTIEQDINSHLLLSWDLVTFAHYKTFSIHDDPNNPAQSLDIGSTGPTIDVDFRDHPFNPTRGSFTRLNIEYGSPAFSSDPFIEYAKAQGSFTHYYPVRTNWVWANSLRAGYIKNLSTERSSNVDTAGHVPYDKKGFQLGGQTTLRGFSPTEAFPNKNDFGVKYDSQMRLTTSATMSLFKSELQFPLYKSFGGALFYDGGSVTLSEPNFNNIGYRHSVGVGIRISTPVGPVNLDYAWKLNMNGLRGEDPSIFHFSIGAF
jgi:outer membrane protein assembly complex protein YaeT